MSFDFSSLPQPASYFSTGKGVYEVAPGLRPFGTSFGNGELDQKVFQFDQEFSRYRENKIACLSENARKGPFVRFAWGFSTDTRLNHHPEPPLAFHEKSG